MGQYARQIGPEPRVSSPIPQGLLASGKRPHNAKFPDSLGMGYLVMAQNLTNCPVCEGRFGLCREMPTLRDSRAFRCDGCGGFEIDGTAFAIWFAPDRRRMTTMQRSALSHAIRSASGGTSPVIIATDWMEAFQRDARLPTPATQAANLIARIGDHVAEEGKGYFIDDVTDTPLIGAFNRTMFNDLLQELLERNMGRRLGRESIPNPRDVGVLSGFLYGLTLAGWERFEAEKRGRFAGHYGFIAMKFDDPVLDPLVSDFIKPAVQKRIGYDLSDPLIFLGIM